MIKQIELQNLRSGESVFLNSDTGQYIIDNIDWGSVKADPVTYRVPFQIGETLSGVVSGTRGINIVGYVIPEYDAVKGRHMTWNEYYLVLEKTIEDGKKVLNGIVNIFDDLLIRVGDYEIKTRPDENIKYSSDGSENNDVLCLFSISLVAYSSLFVKINKDVVNMSSIVSAFHFPLIIPRNKGIVFGIRKRAINVRIDNDSEAATGFRVVVTFLNSFDGTFTVRNVSTQEYIGISNVKAERNDQLIINTETGEEDVILFTDGEYKSVVSKITSGSSFLKMERGKNYYTYDVGKGFIDADISIEFNKKYFSLKDL